MFNYSKNITIFLLLISLISSGTCAFGMGNGEDDGERESSSSQPKRMDVNLNPYLQNRRISDLTFDTLWNVISFLPPRDRAHLSSASQSFRESTQQANIFLSHGEFLKARFANFQEFENFSSRYKSDGINGIEKLRIKLLFVPTVEQWKLFFSNLQSIKALYLAKDSALHDEGALAFNLAQALPQLPRLNTLVLRFIPLEETSVKALTQALPYLSRLTTLSLSWNTKRSGNQLEETLIPALPLIPQLTSLKIMRNTIGTKGVIALSKVLHHLPNLTTLNLSGNSLKKGDAIILAQALPHLPQLTTLILSQNGIGLKAEKGERGAVMKFKGDELEGVQALAQALPHLRELTNLDLDGNFIGENGLRILTEALNKDSTPGKSFSFKCSKTRSFNDMGLE